MSARHHSLWRNAPPSRYIVLGKATNHRSLPLWSQSPIGPSLPGIESGVETQSHWAFPKTRRTGGEQHLPCVTNVETETQKIRYLTQGPSLIN